MGHRSDVMEQMEEKTEIIKTDYQNNSFNDPDFKRLWFDTYEYRKDFIKENTTADIMKQFPAYTNPFTVENSLSPFSSRLSVLDFGRC